MMRTTYATDGRCHNSNHDDGQDPAHECGKPAEWLGTTATGYRAGFCDECRHNGREAKHIKLWARISGPQARRETDNAPHNSPGLAWWTQRLNGEQP